jgi:hypothetical protein
LIKLLDKHTHPINEYLSLKFVSSNDEFFPFDAGSKVTTFGLVLEAYKRNIGGRSKNASVQLQTHHQVELLDAAHKSFTGPTDGADYRLVQFSSAGNIDACFDILGPDGDNLDLMAGFGKPNGQRS